MVDEFLGQGEASWYPRRIILPIIEQTQCSVIVLDCGYEKLNFDLLWDSPVNNDLSKLLPCIKNIVARLTQSWHGSFQEYHLNV
jgi:hypothetical protein